MTTSTTAVEGVEIGADPRPDVLTTEVLAWLAELERAFGAQRISLLDRRRERRAERTGGATLDFLTDTQHVRDGDWAVAPPPPALRNRRVEITGPTDAKMLINAFNSGSTGFMADFEDSNTPSWDNLVQGQANLSAAIARTLTYTSPDGRDYTLNDEIATLLVRPRGWHLHERHLRVDGEVMSGSLFDFGVFVFHNAQTLAERGWGPFFYLPKMESHLEARLWNDVFSLTEERLGLEAGTIKATVLIETLPAAFEMDEILYELREHSAGLNAGRWDYLFSAIKTFPERPEFVLPDRNSVTMAAPFMTAYATLLVKTCHRRGAHAMGGMAAFIPSRRDAELNEKALAKVHEDKRREATAGFDGTWVAHPDLVPVAMEEFDEVLQGRDNQVDRQRDDVTVTAADLLDVSSAEGQITEEGLRSDANVTIQYVSSWLRGNGAAGIYNMMEDAATAEIARSQLWQWIHHGVPLVDGRQVTRELVRTLAAEELDKIRGEVGEEFFAKSRADDAMVIFEQVCLGEELVEFLTLPAYELLD
ncbi:MAG: malate synthase A [Nocardioidaceae bacterium]|nr:malate synthase A [Nocardioidaceae bacterium]